MLFHMFQMLCYADDLFMQMFIVIWSFMETFTK